MRQWAILLLLAGIASPLLASKSVTVDQLEQVVKAAQGKGDGRISQELADLKLTERLSPVRLARWESELPGEKSRRSLLVLADQSAFLDLPAGEIPDWPAPDFARQCEIMAMTVDYTKGMLHKLPNFFATRDTVLFMDSPQARRADSSLVPYEPIHQVNKTSETVLYREGKEVVDGGTGVRKRMKYQPGAQSLTTRGVFGPILGNTLVDAAHGITRWSHWEQGPAGPMAVFQFSVPKAQAHYSVDFCCFLQNVQGSRSFHSVPGYHGEIAVDPADGTIYRLTLVADLNPADPVWVSDILVEYGSVEIGGKNYVCPLKSVSLWVASGSILSTSQTLLNHVDFAQYHLFRSESRILLGNEGETP